MAMAVDERGTRYVEPPAVQAAQAALVAGQNTDAAAVAAKPAGAKYANNTTEANRQAFVKAYTRVYVHMVYEVELLVDSGLDLDTATSQVKQRHRHDPLMGKVVDAAGEKVKGESAEARHINEVVHQGRPSFVGGNPDSPPKFNQPAPNTRAAYAQAGKNLTVKLPASKPLIDSRVEIAAG